MPDFGSTCLLYLGPSAATVLVRVYPVWFVYHYTNHLTTGSGFWFGLLRCTLPVLAYALTSAPFCGSPDAAYLPTYRSFAPANRLQLTHAWFSRSRSTFCGSFSFHTPYRSFAGSAAALHWFVMHYLQFPTVLVLPAGSHGFSFYRLPATTVLVDLPQFAACLHRAVYRLPPTPVHHFTCTVTGLNCARPPCCFYGSRFLFTVRYLIPTGFAPFTLWFNTTLLPLRFTTVLHHNLRFYWFNRFVRFRTHLPQFYSSGSHYRCRTVYCRCLPHSSGSLLPQFGSYTWLRFYRFFGSTVQ